MSSELGDKLAPSRAGDVKDGKFTRPKAWDVG